MKPNNLFIKLLNPFCLCFRDKKIESEFTAYYKKSIINHVRIAVLSSLLIYLSFAWLDAAIFPEYKSAFLQIRFFIVMPVTLLAVLYKFISKSLKYMQQIVSFVAFVGAFGIIAMLYIGGQEVSTIYYVGLCLVFIFNYDFLRLRFLPASLVGLLTLLGYVYVDMQLDYSFQFRASSLFFLLAANILGMGSAYYFEYISRKSFYSNLLFEREKEKVANANLHLEAEVKARTASLIEKNRDLIEAREKALESDRLKSIFLATMSHELRTPLNAIIGFSQFIVSENDADSENVEFAQIINNSGLHLLSLIDGLFDITLIESGQIKVNASKVSLVNIMSEAHNIIQLEQNKLDKENIEISYSCTNINTDFKIFSDGNKIKQILINLLKNALKFTDKGEIKFWCEEIKQDEKAIIKFYVSDTGIGIQKDRIKLIFDVFRQVDDDHCRKYGGMGIGLSIARQLAGMLGGEVGVESVPEKGSTFYFTVIDFVDEKQINELIKNEGQ